MEKCFKLNSAKKVFDTCLVVNSSLLLDMGTELRPLLRTDFSASESSRFSGIVTTV